jgi:NADH-quinone oxidoreductase subunit L
LTVWLVRTPVGDMAYRFWLSGWGFDWVYGRLLVRPYVFLAHLNRNDVIDRLVQGIVLLNRLGNRGLIATTQSGRVRWYATGFALGAVVIIGLAVFL